MVWAVLAWTAMLRPRPLLGLRVFVQRECPRYDNLKLPVVGPFFAPGCSGGALAIWGPLGPYIKGPPAPVPIKARKAFSLLVYFYLLSSFDGSSSCSCAGFCSCPCASSCSCSSSCFCSYSCSCLCSYSSFCSCSCSGPPRNANQVLKGRGDFGRIGRD